MSNLEQSIMSGWPTGGGATGDRIRAQDWSATSLGPSALWPPQLRSSLALCLDASAPLGVLWGGDLLFFWNDRWQALRGRGQATELGRPLRAAAPDLWPMIGPGLTRIATTGRPFEITHGVLPSCEPGTAAAGWCGAKASPIRDEAGAVLGVFVVGAEETAAAWAAAADDRPAVHAIGTDIHDARPAEERLRASEAFLRRVLASSEDCIKVLSLDGRLELLSEGGQRARRPGHVPPALGSRWPDAFLDDDQDKAREAVAEAVAGRTGRFEARTPCGPHKPCWWDTIVTPIPGADGRPEKLLALSRDVTLHHDADRHVAASEQRFRSLLEGIPQLVWQAHAGGAWTWCSPQWTAFTGQSVEDSLGERWLDALHPDDREAARAAWQKATRTGSMDVDYRVRQVSDGHYRWFTTHAAPFREAADGTSEWLGASTDIHDLRSLQERQRAILAELQHRTRNLIAVIRSIARQTLRTTKSREAFWTSYDDRLHALSRAQDLLARGADRAVTLEELACAELDVLGAVVDGGRVRIAGPEVELRRSAVQTLALALHELATNAAKHGALTTAHGRLSLTWRVKLHENDGQHLELSWIEEGIESGREGWSAQRRGYGRELIERMLPYQLDAHTSYELDETGVRCLIELPLERRPPPPGGRRTPAGDV